MRFKDHCSAKGRDNLLPTPSGVVGGSTATRNVMPADCFETPRSIYYFPQFHNTVHLRGGRGLICIKAMDIQFTEARYSPKN